MTTVISGSYPAINSDSDATVNGLTVGKGGGAGSDNTVVGYQAALNATGNYLTAVGYQAGYSNTDTAFANAFFGRQAGKANTSGGGGVAVGNAALTANTTGNQNTAVGASAMEDNTTGSNNTAVGSGALGNNITATRNTAVGYQAGYALTTGGANVVVGDNAFKTATTADNTVAIGTYALENTTGIYNTAVGAGAGGAITSGAKNTIIGRYNGNQGGLDIRTASNYIVLSDGDGNPRVMVNPTGYTKISNNAGWEQTNTFHNIVQTAADTTLIVTNTNANPFGLVLKHANAAPNANSNAFLTCEDNSGGGRVVVRIWSNGNMQNLNNSYGSLSDQAIKENIVDATPKLADLMQVKIRNFNLIGDETKQIGVIAQELETVFPSMVESTEDGFKGVKYSVFVPMLIKAVQELNAKVEAQAAEIAALKGANNG